MSDKNQNAQNGQNPTKPEDKKPETTATAATAEKPKYPERARVRTVNGGTMRHLITDVEINGDEKKIDLDHFAIAQIEAGKWEIVTD